MYKAQYFDLSENMCLERLDLTVDVTNETRLCPCTPVVDILSHVTSTQMSRIAVLFRPRSNLDADWRTLIVGLPQIDDVLSWPIFENLAHVSIGVRTWDGLDVGDEERADELRACLPKLDQRGILGCIFI